MLRHTMAATLDRIYVASSRARALRLDRYREMTYPSLNRVSDDRQSWVRSQKREESWDFVCFLNQGRLQDRSSPTGLN